MKISEKKMDLFKTDVKYALGHCISLDCAMGLGIAKTFDKKFPQMKGTLKAIISQNNIKHPFTIMYSKDNIHTERKVFNLITKKKYWQKPTYDTITETIKQIVKMCEAHNIKYLALPRIGSGLDKLNWNKVKEIIQEEFKDLDIEILICYI